MDPLYLILPYLMKSGIEVRSNNELISHIIHSFQFMNNAVDSVIFRKAILDSLLHQMTFFCILYHRIKNKPKPPKYCGDIYDRCGQMQTFMLLYAVQFRLFLDFVFQMQVK